jgi:uncharacterized integral membrane protein
MGKKITERGGSKEKKWTILCVVLLLLLLLFADWEFKIYGSFS